MSGHCDTCGINCQDCELDRLRDQVQRLMVVLNECVYRYRDALGSAGGEWDALERQIDLADNILKEMNR